LRRSPMPQFGPNPVILIAELLCHGSQLTGRNVLPPTL
jgi:hypothetical protein